MKELLGEMRRAQGDREVDESARPPRLSDAYSYPPPATPAAAQDGCFLAPEEEDELTDEQLAALEVQARIAVAKELESEQQSPQGWDLRPSDRESYRASSRGVAFAPIGEGMEVQRQIWRENFGRGGETRRSTVQGPPLRTLDNFLERGWQPEKEWANPNVNEDTKDERVATFPNEERRRRWSWHTSGTAVVNRDPLWPDPAPMRARLLGHAHNNVEESDAPINLKGGEGLVLLHDSDPNLLAHLQRKCIERLRSNANLIRTLPSLYAIEALVDQSPWSFEVVLMDLTQDAEGGLVLAQKLRAHNVPVVVTANRQAFSPMRFVRLLQELMLGDIQFLPQPYTYNEFHTVAFSNSPRWQIKTQSCKEMRRQLRHSVPDPTAHWAGSTGNAERSVSYETPKHSASTYTRTTSDLASDTTGSPRREGMGQRSDWQQAPMSLATHIMDLFARMLDGETPARSEVMHLYTQLLQGGAMGSTMHMPMAPTKFLEEDVTAPWELISRGPQRAFSGGSTQSDSTNTFDAFTVAWEDFRDHGGEIVMPEILKRMGLEADILAAAAAAPANAARPDAASRQRRVTRILASLPKYNFDSFELSELTGGHPLAYAAVVAFSKVGLITHFDLDAFKVLNYMKGVEEGMPPNQYHNKEHAADVFNSAVYLLVHGGMSHFVGENGFSALDVMAYLVAAAVHDLGHPGGNSDNLVDMGDIRALVFNAKSVLENMHAMNAFLLFMNPSMNFLTVLGEEQFKLFRTRVVSLVLSTDMAVHATVMGNFQVVIHKAKQAGIRRATMESEFDSEGCPAQPHTPGMRGSVKSASNVNIGELYPEELEVVLCLALKCADLGSFRLSYSSYQRWVVGLVKECSMQGQAMLDKNLSVLPRSMYDPTATQADIARGQLLFINNCVTPMFHAWTMLFPNAKAMQSFIDGTMSNAMRLQIVVDAQLIPQSAAKPQRQSPAIRADGAVARRLSGD